MTSHRFANSAVHTHLYKLSTDCFKVTYLILEAIDSALAKDKDMLDKAMFDGIMHARAQLEAVAQDTDETIIKDKIGNLEAISAKFVQMRMNSTISKAMRGHNVEEFQE
jgi:molecular chaperone HscA